MSEHELSHLNEKGEARMVDVSSKSVTAREALAEAFVRVSPEVLSRVRSGGADKGDVVGVARVAGIMAAKRTADLIPLCHPIALSSSSVDLDVGNEGITIRATAKTTERTGVEMEALVAASVAALTVYDMVKSLDRSASIEKVRLLKKSGGKSGEWSRGE